MPSTAMPNAKPQPIRPIRDLLASMAPSESLLPKSTQSFAPQNLPTLPTPPPPWKSLASSPSPHLSAPANTPRLRVGCYAAVFKSHHPDLSVWPSAVGTLRWEESEFQQVTASGDLYVASAAMNTSQDVEATLATAAGYSLPPENTPVIPKFCHDRYHAYFQISQPWIPEPITNPDPAQDPQAPVPLSGSWHRIRNAPSNTWFKGTPVLFHRTDSTPDPQSPSEPCLRAKFNLTDTTGLPLGELHVRWISPYFRDAVVEIDTESGLAAPGRNATPESWESLFAAIGWSVRTEFSRLRMPSPPSGRWTYAELHDLLVSARASSNLDSEWRYHVCIVHSLADPNAPLSLCFDHESADVAGVPREGVVLCGGTPVPELPPHQHPQGRTLAECPELYFRVAVREVGLAMGLQQHHLGFEAHPSGHDAVEPAPRENNLPSPFPPIFSPEEVFQLRHLPDIQVRPGGDDPENTDVSYCSEADPGFPFIQTSRPSSPSIPHSDTDPMVLRLSLASLKVPVGAPIRVDFQWINHGPRPVPAPAHLSLATPYVSGCVIQPGGLENPFRSFFKPIDPGPWIQVGPQGVLSGSFTLLRGRFGAFNPRPGPHDLWVEVAWTHAGRRWSARQCARFQSLAASTPEESRAARRLLRTPETLAYLVLGNTRAFPEAEAAVDAALDVDVLRPHFAYIKAKAAATAYRHESPCWEKVHELLANESTLAVLNQREREKACTLRAIAEIKTAISVSLPDPNPELLSTNEQPI